MKLGGIEDQVDSLPLANLSEEVLNDPRLHQTSPHSARAFAPLKGHGGDFLLDFEFVDLDVLIGRDAIEDEMFLEVAAGHTE